MERTGGMALGGTRMPVRVPKGLLRLRPDARLVEHVRAGDDAAFEVLYARHVAGILAFCRHMLGSREEAEDATQHTFVAAHRDIRRSRRELALKPWLYTIARNRCLSVLRARQERPAADVELSTAGLQTEVERRADVRELLADVARLPEDQRAALVLTELGDLSHAEVATVLGCKAAAVKGIVFRARNALVERREARAADCTAIREQIAVATGGAMRRSRLRYHLESCPGCVAYLEEVRRQRKLLGVGLPVVPTLALHDSVMASVGIGAGGAVAATAAGGAATSGGAVAGTSLLGLGSSAAGGTLAKVAIVGALAGGAGVATEAAITRDGGGSPAPAAVPAAGEGNSSGRTGEAGGVGAPRSSATGRTRSAERSRGRRGEERRRRGRRNAARHRGARGAAGHGPDRSGAAPPPGRALGRAGDEPRGQGHGVGHAPRPPAPQPAPGAAPRSVPRATPAPRRPAPPRTPSPASPRPSPSPPPQAVPTPRASPMPQAAPPGARKPPPKR